MEIEIDLESETPIFAQLIEQVKSGVALGSLKTGTSLPAIRTLAKELGINPNTVSKAYKLLERDGVIVTKGYRGTFIHPDAVNNSQSNVAEQALAIIQQAVTQARSIGATDSEIRIAVAEVMKQGGSR